MTCHLLLTPWPYIHFPLGRAESLVSEAGCPEHSLRPRVPQPVGIRGGHVVMGRRARGPLRGIKIPCERVPGRAPPVTSAAWLGEAGVGQCPALRASHRLVPAHVSAALGWEGGARLVPLGGWSGAIGGNSCLHFTGPQRTGTQIRRHPSLLLLVRQMG